MEANIEPKKIAFCITCMNRLHHLQQTLEKNILDNYLPDDVEFVLLDYNSQDGLELWVYHNMMQHIESGMLIYYKTLEPQYYLRSHSRNMVFRLANADILCNLDADNFLGEGFASFIINEFAKQERIFYTSDCSFEDIFGRVCLLQEDFYKIKGYNEALNGYGYEDVDFFVRLYESGLKQKYFYDREFYHVILHSKAERIAEEYMVKNTHDMYISYVNPYQSIVLLLYKDGMTEQYTLIDNPHLALFSDVSTDENVFSNEQTRITMQGDCQKGSWQQNDDKIHLQADNYQTTFNHKSSIIEYQNKIFYLIRDIELQTDLIMLLTSAINFHKAKKQLEENQVINPTGFGQGTVYKNFDHETKIILS